TQHQFAFLAISPVEQPDVDLALAWSREGAAAAVDLGRQVDKWQGALAAIPRGAGLGLRIPDGQDASHLTLPDSVAFLIVDAGALESLPQGAERVPLLVQVKTAAEARAALALGAQGLIAKGAESGGLVGEESAFILLQQVVDEAAPFDCPVWCQGGMGLSTCAGAFTAGAFGVVLDSVLSIYPESSLPPAIKQRAARLDTGDVRTVDGFKFSLPPGRPLTQSIERQELERLLTSEAHEALAFGQDTALARICLEACPTLHALLRALHLRVPGQIHQAQALRALDENASWAAAHGLRVPVAQGPMTRVSDTAAFAGQVAEQGGLPFLALALMGEAPCRALMEESKALLGDKPWGVGVLGFADEAVLGPQMALIKALRPPVVLIAGARPSQAREMADEGITAYVHAPSPGLLEMFLGEGLRHFVFEGRECGGHVGPRYSLVLWEQVIDILKGVDKPEELHLLFAGGIHDARSAAMLAAITAPLTALGAKIGVLMGSAYIGTQEAVTHGAVVPEFHERVLGGEATVIIETAPGHAIRCLPTPFIDEFNATKAQLPKAQASHDVLEGLLVGRLRIASKGLERRDGALTQIERDEQYAQGVYMIGQAVAFQREPSTIAKLHWAVSAGAVEHLRQLEPPMLSQPSVQEPIAIVGMSCIYPGSPDLEAYWDNVLQGRDLIAEVPADRWSTDLHWDGGPARAGMTPSKWGGFLGDVAIDPLAYGIPPQSFGAVDPAQLLALHAATMALKDGGYDERYFDRARTAVIVATDGGLGLARRYHFRNFFRHYCGEMPDALDAMLPSLTEDSFPGVLGNVIAGRIANRLGLGGMNFTVDAACGSSLAALEVAVKELRHGDARMVLLGGVDCHNDISDYLLFASAGALSPTGRCRPFDKNADGIALGEGVGMLVLKRLSDAERDNDRIYAVIEGVAGASDGKELGLTAPRKAGQKLALERTYAQAGVAPFQIGLVEAHGTGTVAGDRTELSSLTEVYGAGGALPASVGLGSVKGQIGHTKCAAGVAGLIKAAKALHHRVLPGTQQVAQPNAAWRDHSSPFVLNEAPTPWSATGDVRRAAV
ncbi:MAG: beta-ketoacyl synthase N-terminal-like domain-containing protein, partial [Caulobacter sp.]